MSTSAAKDPKFSGEVSPERSAIMRAVGRSNTPPEKRVRSFLHALGFRFTLHDPKLPGRPDIVLPKYRTVVFVHGCYWHRHPGCRKASTPKTRREFWEAKFAANVARDERKARELEEAGWRVLTVWECQTKDAEALRSILAPLLVERSEEAA